MKSEGTRIELVEGYFDENADSWSALYSKAQRANDVVLKDRKDSAVAALTKNLPSGSRILDAGCGAGLTSVDLVKQGYRVHAIDISQKMLDLCRENLSKEGCPADAYELARADLDAASFEDEAFDGIAALGFLQYQENEGATLTHLKRILKPGGVLVVTGPTKRRISNLLGLAPRYKALRNRLAGRAQATMPVEHQVLHKISDNYYTPGRFRELLSGAGFEVLDARGHGYANYAILSRRLGFKGEMFLHRNFTRLSRVVPIGRWANDIIAVARKPKG